MIDQQTNCAVKERVICMATSNGHHAPSSNNFTEPRYALPIEFQ